MASDEKVLIDRSIASIIRPSCRVGKQRCPGSCQRFFSFTHCSFDLFSAVLFGEMTNTANPNAKNKSDDFQTNIRFAECTAAGLGESFNILFDPFEQIIDNPLGITTKRQQFCFDNFDII